MNRFLSIIMILSFFVCSAQVKNNRLKKLLSSHHKQMEKEFSLHLLDERLQKDKLGKLCFDYCYYDELDVLKARLMIHKVSESILTKLNQSLSLRSILPHHPLTHYDLDISISTLSPKTKKRFSFDHLTNAALLGGVIHYSEYQAKSGEITPLLSEAHSK